MLINARTSIARFRIGSFTVSFITPYFDVSLEDGVGLFLRVMKKSLQTYLFYFPLLGE